MFGRRTRSLLPVRRISKPACTRQAIKKKSKRRLIVKWTYDKGARDLPQLTPGQSVYHQHTEKKNCDWRRGIIRAKHSYRSYIVEGKDGVYRRNRIHILPTAISDNKLDHEGTRSKNPSNSKVKKADVPTRPQRDRKKPHWTRDYELKS